MKSHPLHPTQTTRPKSEPSPSMIICFAAIACGAFNAAHQFAHWVVLRKTYGSFRVEQEHLYVIDEKGKDLVFSNGVVVPPGLAAAHLIIMVAGFMILSALLCFSIFHLFPKEQRPWRLSEIPARLAGVLFVAILLGEFFLITFGPLARCEGIAAIVVVGSIAGAWIVRAFVIPPYR